jgi:hypothetical protein
MPTAIDQIADQTHALQLENGSLKRAINNIGYTLKMALVELEHIKKLHQITGSFSDISLDLTIKSVRETITRYNEELSDT